MKRMISLITVVALVLSAACAAAAGVTFSTDYFTLQLPDEWEIDTEDLESEDGRQCLGYFGGPEDIDLVGVAYLVYYEELKDFALWNSDDEELQAYTDVLLEEYKDSNPELIGVVKADKIPLVMIRNNDDDGEFIYVDTITNGYSVQIIFELIDANGEKTYPVTEEKIGQIKDILATFLPVTK